MTFDEINEQILAAGNADDEQAQLDAFEQALKDSYKESDYPYQITFERWLIQRLFDQSKMDATAKDMLNRTIEETYGE